MTQTIRQFAFLIGLMAIGLGTACTSSGSQEANETPETAVVEPTPVASTALNTRIEPFFLTEAPRDIEDFEIAFTSREADAVLAYYLAPNAPFNEIDIADLVEGIEMTDFATSMLVATSTQGCNLEEVSLNPHTNALQLISVFDDTYQCAEPTTYGAAFVVPLQGAAANGGEYDYSASAVPAVVPDTVAAIAQFSLSERPEQEAEPFPLPLNAIESDAWVDLFALDWNAEDTRFVLDEDDLAWLQDAVNDGGWNASVRPVERLDLSRSFAVALIVELCSPTRFWVESTNGELLFSVGESGSACDAKDPYLALFTLPREWLTAAGQTPEFSVDRLTPPIDD